MATAIPRSAQAHGQATVSLRIPGPIQHPRGHRAGVIHLHQGRIAEVTQHRAEAVLHRGAIHHPHAHPEAIHHLHAVQADPRVVAAEAPVVVVAVAAEEEGAKTIT